MRRFVHFAIFILSGFFALNLFAQVNVHICAIRVEFEPEDNPLTVGDGRFMIDTVTTDPHAIDPTPHDKVYFKDQINALANYFRNVSGGNLEITGDVFPSARNSAYKVPQTMSYYNPNTTSEEVDQRLAELFVDALEAADLDIEWRFSDYDVVFLALELECRRTGRHTDVRNPGNGIDDLLGDPVTEILVFRIGAHVGKWQHCNSGPLGLPQNRTGSMHERRAEFERRGVPVAGDPRQRLADCGLDMRRDGLAHYRHGGCLLDGLPGKDRLRGRCSERRIAGEHLVQHAGEAVDVTSTIDTPIPARLFRRHVRRRSYREARLGQALTARNRHGARDPEVGDDGVSGLEHDVLRLDVAVDDTQ